MNIIFKQILGSCSLTAIGYIAERALPIAATPEEQKALKAIIETNCLDEAYAIAHDQLGQHEEAVHLRAWMAREKPQMDPELGAMLAI